DLARLVSDILVEEGLAKRTGDTIQVTSPPEKPVITTQDAADIVQVVDRAMLALPQALETGAKPNLAEEKAAYAKLLGSLSFRLVLEATIEEGGLNKLSEKAVIADVYPRIGTSTITLLELTRAKIIVVEPYPDNIEILKRTIKLAGQEGRVTIIQSTPEEMSLPEKVDDVFMGNILHWTYNPRLALIRARESLKPGGRVSIVQFTYSSTGLTMGLLHYFYGAVRPPPTPDELRGIVEGAGFDIDIWRGSFGIVGIRGIPR
ncbi:MAG: class I SAM-dependent methyltransferase, partial [Thermofilaceae archaeon]